MRTRLSIIFLAVLLISTFSVVSSADEGYTYAERSNRWEGLDRIPTGGKGIVLQSFLGHRQSMALSKDLEMKVRFYLPEAGDAYLRAVESRRSGASHYQMRPFNTTWQSGWNEFAPWQAADVLLPLSINPERINVLVRVKSDRAGSGRISPAILYSNAMPATIDAYVAVILPTVTLSKVTYFLGAVDSGETVQAGKMKDIGANVPFTINLDLSGRAAGEYRLLITAAELGRTKGPSRQYFFYHAPNPSG